MRIFVALPLAALASAALAGGCALLTGSYACESDDNCPSGDACVAGTCASAVTGEGEGAASEGEGAEGEGEGGEGEGEGGEGEGAAGEGEGAAGEGEGEGAAGEGEGEGAPDCTEVGGDHSLFNNGDINQFHGDLPGGSGCVTLTGSLFVHGNFTNLPDLHRVARIEGDFVVSNTGSSMHDLHDLANLVQVDANVDVQNTQLHTIDLPALAKIGASLTVSNNAAVSTVDFSALREVDQDASFTNNGNLPCSDSQAVIDALTTFSGTPTNTGCG